MIVETVATTKITALTYIAAPDPTNISTLIGAAMLVLNIIRTVNSMSKAKA